MEGNLRFKIDWTSLIIERNLLFCFEILCILRAISKNKPPGPAYIWRGDLTEGFFGLRVWGFLFGGDYAWRGLFSEFYGRLRAETIYFLTTMIICGLSTLN